MDTTLSQRVLPGLESRLDSTIVIVSNSMFDTDCTIRLYLIAPDLAELDELRADLCARLKKSLTDVDPNWVHDVTIEYHFETGEPEIIVEINDVSLLGNRSLDRILASAETFVTPFAAKHQRSVYVLKDDQCLVPLTFDQPITSTAMNVVVPAPLTLRAPKRHTGKNLIGAGSHVPGPIDRSVAGRVFLTRALELAFDRADWIDNVVVSESGHGIHVAVNFDTRAPSPYTVNTTQNIIMTVLGQHATLAGFVNKSLVFVSMTPADADDYNDSGDYHGF